MPYPTLQSFPRQGEIYAQKKPLRMLWQSNISIRTVSAKKRTLSGLAVTQESAVCPEQLGWLPDFNSETLISPYFKIRPALALLERKHNLEPHESGTRRFGKLAHNKS